MFFWIKLITHKWEKLENSPIVDKCYWIKSASSTKNTAEIGLTYQKNSKIASVSTEHLTVKSARKVPLSMQP